MWGVVLSVLCSISVVAQVEEQGSIRRVDGVRTIQTVQGQDGIMSHALRFIASCKSSTSFSGGAGGSPLLAITEFCDLIATRPSMTIPLQKVVKVDDKSGAKGEPQLELSLIIIVDIADKLPRVYSYTEFGLLVEFREGDEKLLAYLSRTLRGKP